MNSSGSRRKGTTNKKPTKQQQHSQQKGSSLLNRHPKQQTNQTNHSIIKAPFTDKSHTSNFFQFFPRSFNQPDSQVIQAENTICKKHFYTNQHIELRSKCLQLTKSQISKMEGQQNKEMFKKIFLQFWPHVLEQFRLNSQLDHHEFLNYFYCTGDFAYQIVQMDLLKLLLRKPLTKFSKALKNQQLLQNEKQISEQESRINNQRRISKPKSKDKVTQKKDFNPQSRKKQIPQVMKLLPWSRRKSGRYHE